MYQLPNEKRAQILPLLCEGMGINATTRITGVSKHTVRKLLANAREPCAYYQDETMRGLKCKRADCDEIWSFVGTKEKNVPEALKDTFGFVNLYTYQWNSRHNRPARRRSQPPTVLRALLHG